jgi:hypothetical protein
VLYSSLKFCPMNLGGGEGSCAWRLPIHLLLSGPSLLDLSFIYLSHRLASSVLPTYLQPQLVPLTRLESQETHLESLFCSSCNVLLSKPLN